MEKIRHVSYESYNSFTNSFVDGLVFIGHPGISLLGFGSYFDKSSNFKAGLSDVDLAIIFPGGPIIDKKLMSEVSKAYAYAHYGLDVPVGITVLDLATFMDGRFNTYTPSFQKTFLERGRVIFGPDYGNLGVFENPFQFEEQPLLRANIKRYRYRLLLAESNLLNNDYSAFKDGFDVSRKAILNSCKQIVHWATGEAVYDKFSMMNDLEKIFPEVDITQLSRMKELYQSADKYTDLIKDTVATLDFWKESTTFAEQVITAYIKKFSRHDTTRSLY